jgi:hypothetical protein
MASRSSRILRIGGEFHERDILSELDTIATLYFPELQTEVADFARACSFDRDGWRGA